MGVILNTVSRLRFTDGIEPYQSFLSTAETLQVGVPEILNFTSASVPPAMQEGIYPITLYLYGTDFNTASYADTLITTGA
ncbi:hypothetical protein AMJ40_01285, partial [candidate division TA06 bacterium DG_26]